MAHEKFSTWHGTTIIGVKKNGKVVIAGDGQVSLGQTVIKGTAKKVRKLSPGGHDVIAGFAGSTADAFTLLERLEAKLDAMPGQLARASVELAMELEGKVKIAKVDVDTNPSAAASMGVRGIPALFIFKDGEVVSNRAGAAPKAALQSWIEESI